MSIIEQLNDDLAQAKIDKEKVVAPYVARIKYLENAIKYLQGYTEKTNFINSRGEEHVKSLD